MRFISIEMEGFQSYLERERVDLDGLNLVAVIGPNGSGKTTMLNGIEFALFGKFRGDGINSVISRGAKQADVTVEFKLNGDTYKVRRVKSGTRHEVYVNVEDETAEDGWRVLEEKNPKMADPFLRELIGMDYETARTTWLIGQNDFGAFCELQPAQRRVVLTNAFGLNKFVALAARAEENIASTDRELGTVQVKLEGTKARREALEADVADTELHPLNDEDLAAEGDRIEVEDEKVSAALSADLGDVDSLQQRMANAQEGLRTILGAHEKDVARHAEDIRRTGRAFQQAQDAVRQARESRDTASAASWDITDAKEAMEAAQAKVEKIEADLPALREQVMANSDATSTYAAKMDASKTAAAEINERIEALKKTAHGHEGECFACGQALSEERAKKMLDELEADKDSLRASYGEAEKEGRAASAAKKEAQQKVGATEQDLRAAQSEAKRAETGHRDLVKSAEALPQLEVVLAKVQETLDEATKEQDTATKAEAPVLDEARVSSLRAEGETASELLQAAKASSENRQELRTKRDGLRSRHKRVWAEQSRRERVAKEIAALEKPIADLQVSHDLIAKDLLTYRALRDAFRPSGIPAMILSGVVEELNDDANEVLMDLGGQFGVNVTTQREKATGGVDEKVMVYVTTPEGEIDYTSLSGSERFRCALALRIALARCIARRTGTPIETIIMDEGWGSLDDEYRKSVQDVLLSLSTDFAVYTVSHIEEIKAAFPTVIEVNKDSGTSRAHVYSR